MQSRRRAVLALGARDRRAARRRRRRRRRPTITAALVSDIGKFNDRASTRTSSRACNKAKKKLGITAIPLQSNSVSDYIPNLTLGGPAERRHRHRRRLPARRRDGDDGEEVPGHDFAITDYSVEAAPFADKKGKPLYKNVEGLTYAANEGGCLVGVLAAQEGAEDGQQDDRRRRRHQDPAGRHLDRRLQVLRAEGRARARRCSSATRRTSSPPTSARRSPQNQIAQGAQVLFQVAGGCGLGTLKAADEAGHLGHRRRRRPVQRSRSASSRAAIKRVDNGVYQAIQQVKAGKFQGGTDLVFNLKNGGIGVGKINPAVPASYIALMNALQGEDHRRQAEGPVVALDVAARIATEGRADGPPLACRSAAFRIARASEPTTPVLEMRGITKEFPGIVANDHVDFELRRGEVHALLGENGAGKSTLMNILYGLYKPDAGEIRLERQAGHVRARRRTRSRPGSGWCTSTSC